MYQDLRGKRVLITGGSAGIGAATAQAFSNSGATVTVSGRNITRLEGTISSLSGQAFAAVGDLNDLGQCREVVQTAIDRMGGLDVVINCGAPRTEAMLQDPDSPDALLAGFQFHVLSAAAIIQQALPQLIKNKGRIVNVSSAVSRIPQPDNACYTVSKAALDSLTRVWALKYAKHGIRVNSVLAGPTMTTGMIEAAGRMGKTVEDLANVVAQKTVLGRVSRPEEQASAILFLASDASSYVTGENLSTDGGAQLGFWGNKGA